MTNPVGGFPIYKPHLSHAVPITLQRSPTPSCGSPHKRGAMSHSQWGRRASWYTLPEQAPRDGKGSLHAQVCSGHLRSLEFWDAEDGLHHKTEMATLLPGSWALCPGRAWASALSPSPGSPTRDHWLDVVVLEPFSCLEQDQWRNTTFDELSFQDHIQNCFNSNRGFLPFPQLNREINNLVKSGRDSDGCTRQMDFVPPNCALKNH